MYVIFSPHHALARRYCSFSAAARGTARLAAAARTLVRLEEEALPKPFLLLKSLRATSSKDPWLATNQCGGRAQVIHRLWLSSGTEYV
jgi:hypothetical protein